MQIGRRWRVGDAPPASLPPVVIAAIHGVEQELATADADASAWGWTLTYLEGRPVVDLDDGTRIRYLPEQDHAVVHSVDFEAADFESD